MTCESLSLMGTAAATYSFILGVNTFLKATEKDEKREREREKEVKIQREITRK